MLEKGHQKEHSTAYEEFYKVAFTKQCSLLARVCVAFVVLYMLAEYSNHLAYNDTAAELIVKTPLISVPVLGILVLLIVPYIEFYLMSNPMRAPSSNPKTFWLYALTGHYKNQYYGLIKEIDVLTEEIKEEQTRITGAGKTFDPTLTQDTESMSKVKAIDVMFISLWHKPIIILISILVFFFLFLTPVEASIHPALKFMIALSACIFWGPFVVCRLFYDPYKMKEMGIRDFWRHAFYSEIEVSIARLEKIKENKVRILACLGHE